MPTRKRLEQRLSIKRLEQRLSHIRDYYCLQGNDWSNDYQEEDDNLLLEATAIEHHSCERQQKDEEERKRPHCTSEGTINERDD